MSARICVSILPKGMAEALRLIEKAEKAKADFIEIRLDYLEQSRKLKDLSSSTRIPLIATNKLLIEKGFFAGTEAERQQTLLNAASNGFEYVDVDSSSLLREETIRQIRAFGANPIVSYHNYDGVLNTAKMESILNEHIVNGAREGENIFAVEGSDKCVHQLFN